MAIWLCFRSQHHGAGHMWTTVAHLTVGRRQIEGQKGGVRDKAVPIVSYFLQLSPMSFLVSTPPIDSIHGIIH